MTKLSGDERRHVILDRPGHEHDPLTQQAREDVEAALAAARLFDDDGDQSILDGAQRIVHKFPLEYVEPLTSALELNRARGEEGEWPLVARVASGQCLWRGKGAG